MIDDIDFLRMAAPPTAIEYSQTFTAPGTWTKPANVSQVFAFVVGGGGGGGNTNPAIGPVSAGGGGGGGVVGGVVTVTAPVPVTIGAGGLGGPPAGPGAAYGGQTGGTSYFGSAGPGPIPAIPVNTVAAGGGGGGGGATNAVTSDVNGKDAPEIGGGGGGAAKSPWQPVYNRGGRGGFGSPGLSDFNGNGHGGGAWRSIPDNGANSDRRWNDFRGGRGIVWRNDIGYGGGGQARLAPGPGVPIQPLDGANAIANRGGGGYGAWNGGQQLPGGSGVVIVYWYE